MMNYIISFLKWLKSSLDNHSLGASARKLSAFALMVCIVMLHYSYREYAVSQKDFSLFPTILTIDITGILAFLGLTTWQLMKDNKPTEPKPQDNGAGATAV